MGNLSSYYGQLLSKIEIISINAQANNIEFDQSDQNQNSNVSTAERDPDQTSQPPSETDNGMVPSPQVPTAEVNGDDKPPLSIADLKLVIPFGYNSNEVPAEAYEPLNRVTAIMQQNPDIEITVKGYTDTLGYSKYNKKLSEFRANTIKGYLIAKGVSPERIRAIGLGEADPVIPNRDEKPRVENRRVEIELVPGSV